MADESLCSKCRINSGNTRTGGLCLACWTRVPLLEATKGLVAHSLGSVTTTMLSQKIESSSRHQTFSPLSPSLDRQEWGQRQEEAKELEEESTTSFLNYSVCRGWECGKCTFRNALDSATCEICHAPQGAEPVSPVGTGWMCQRCTFQNADPKSEQCSACSVWREWTCGKCTLANRCPATTCAACGSFWNQEAAPKASISRRSRGFSFLDSLSASQVILLKRETQEVKKREKDVDANRKALSVRMKQLGASEQPIANDGACLFRALSFQIWRTQRYHGQLRALAVDHVRRHPQGFAEFVGEEFSDYLDHMSKLSTWGDELTIRAISDAAGITVHVITSDESNWYLRYDPSGEPSLKITGEGGKQVHVFLSYLAPVHYNSLTSQEDKESESLFIEDRADERLMEVRLVADELTRLETLGQAKEQLREKLDRGWKEVKTMVDDLEKVRPDAAKKLQRRETFAAVGRKQRISGGSSPSPVISPTGSSPPAPPPAKHGVKMAPAPTPASRGVKLPPPPPGAPVAACGVKTAAPPPPRQGSSGSV
eukprot:Hpha_TRINITY_DN17550_c0_g1::TRINITY_DN17550_c0_g1_i1::g.92575::m.92575